MPPLPLVVSRPGTCDPPWGVVDSGDTSSGDFGAGQHGMPATPRPSIDTDQQDDAKVHSVSPQAVLSMCAFL